MLHAWNETKGKRAAHCSALAQEYFFPKEDTTSVAERQKKWVKSVEPKTRHSRRGSAASNPGASSDGEAGGPLAPASAFAAATGALDPGPAASASSSPGAPQTRHPRAADAGPHAVAAQLCVCSPPFF